MWRCILVIAFFQLYGESNGELCEFGLKLKQEGIPTPADVNLPCLEDPCNVTSKVIQDQSECPESYCFFDGTTCKQKQITEIGIEGKLFTLGLGSNLNQGLPPISSFGLPPFLPNPQQQQQQCNGFPQNCGINQFAADWKQLAEAPVNVPYCQRIPCAPDGMAFESDSNACHAQPGCYFDEELSLYRKYYGYSVLPGVPVCHKAIRNAKFHQLAAKYVQTSGQQWHAVLTGCLISQNQAAIEEQPPGCYMVSVFEYIGILPKVAGWKGISRRDCILIGGCYDAAIRCFYPAEINSVQVRSGQDPYRRTTPSPLDLYGQPLCQRLDLNDSPERFLDAYHKCRQSGCVVDSYVTSSLLHSYLYNVTRSMLPSHLQYQFWNLVQTNVVSADNWRYHLNKLKRDSRNSNPYNQISNNNNNNNKNNNNGNSALALIAYSLTLNKNNQNQATAASNSQRNFQLPGSSNPRPQSNPIFQNNPFTQLGASPFGSNPNPFLPNSNPFGSSPFPGGNIPFVPNSNGAQIPASIAYLFRPSGGQIASCPYQNLPRSSLGILKGSFEGCCERNLCYIPRSQVPLQRSGVARYFADWESWQPCSVTCGNKGSRRRTRRCVAYKNGETCGDPSEQEETEACGQEECPSWSAWSDFGECSNSCGNRGTKTRRRVCLPRGRGCLGKSAENQACNRGECPRLSSWSAFGDCDVYCGVGLKNRTRECTDGGDFGCDAVRQKLVEFVRCERFCGDVVPESWGNCNRFSCRQLVTWRCGQPGETAHCRRFDKTSYQYCEDRSACLGFFG